ncbi:MAG: alpha/beta hydrolase [Gammaproteobacteria bacterium]|jgi:acetyl esterase/lipase|nr:alpha/beta hydrolase [Gammaproteobacteria bacterium]MBT7371394.1 alpha/beta hydrolase [Gammaproteobacteria bacterium]
MNTLFFLLSLVFGWQAWNLYHPAFTNSKMAAVSFLGGWLTGELAPLVVFWQILGVAFFVLLGAVSGLFGAIGFLICLASWATMAFYYYESTFAEAETSLALKEGLGEDFESQIDDVFRERFPSDPDRNLIRHPLSHDDPLVEVIKDVPFGDHRQTLDIRRARSSATESPKPVLLQIHGGAWTEKIGSKNEQGLPLMNHMAKRDWICVATSYRLSPSATFPEHIIDCKQALIWIKDHIHEYGGDPDFIVVTGGSAGGHLSSLCTLSANHAEFQPGCEDRDTTVQGAVPFYGVYDFTDSHDLHHHQGLVEYLEDKILKLDLAGNEEFYREASPYFHINEDAPPCLIVHGDSDTLIPVACGRVFADELKRVSKNPVVYLECKGAQHAFDQLPSIRSEHVKHGVEKFLTWTYSRYLKSD